MYNKAHVHILYWLTTVNRSAVHQDMADSPWPPGSSSLWARTGAPSSVPLLIGQSWHHGHAPWAPHQAPPTCTETCGISIRSVYVYVSVCVWVCMCMQVCVCVCVCVTLTHRNGLSIAFLFFCLSKKKKKDKKISRVAARDWRNFCPAKFFGYNILLWYVPP